MKPTPNLQLIYVSDIQASTEFYQILFDCEPVFTSPRYVAFSAGDKALFALWTGGTKPISGAPRFSEIGVMLPSNEAVEELFLVWKNIPNLKIIEPPYEEVFGTTFLIEDIDGHLIRVSPLD